MAGESSPLMDLVQRESHEQMLRALEELPTLGRDCLVMHYLEQKPYEAIALQIGKTPHQVRAACHKALSRLRRLLAHQPEPEEVSDDDAG